ncbi:MAG: hypothetical protein ACFFCS_15215, partial [Candidatus Hodarchaeota archaeon]
SRSARSTGNTWTGMPSLGKTALNKAHSHAFISFFFFFGLQVRHNQYSYMFDGIFPFNQVITMAINAILIYTESGILAYDAKFEDCRLNSELVSAFATAISNFGLEIFPEDQLDDIIFKNHHIIIERHEINEELVTFLVIHDPSEAHGLLSEIIAKIHGELVEKYPDLFGKQGFNQKKLEPLDAFIEKLFKDLGRPENSFACLY